MTRHCKVKGGWPCKADLDGHRLCAIGWLEANAGQAQSLGCGLQHTRSSTHGVKTHELAAGAVCSPLSHQASCALCTTESSFQHVLWHNLLGPRSDCAALPRFLVCLHMTCQHSAPTYCTLPATSCTAAVQCDPSAAPAPSQHQPHHQCCPCTAQAAASCASHRPHGRPNPCSAPLAAAAPACLG